MSGDLVRLSDADRERVVARLNAAVGDGRLTLAEFEQRVDGVLRATTFGEVEPYLADLPALVPEPDEIELRGQAGSIKRTGRWRVPRRLVVHSATGSVKLDLRQAVIDHPVVRIELHTQAGSTTVVLPRGATADADAVNSSAGSVAVKVPSVRSPGEPHVVLAGSAAAGSVTVRYERRFWRWTW